MLNGQIGFGLLKIQANELSIRKCRSHEDAIKDRAQLAEVDSIGRLEEAGADRVIVALPRDAGADAVSAAIDQLAEKVFS